MEPLRVAHIITHLEPGGAQRNTLYTVSHLGLDPTLKKNVRAAYYESGHMMYVRLASLAKMKADLAAFYGRALEKR